MDTVGTDPHLEVVRAAVKESVGDDAVGGGCRARGKRRLHGARDRGKPGGKRHAPAAGRKPRQHGHSGEILGPQAGNGEQKYVHKGAMHKGASHQIWGI